MMPPITKHFAIYMAQQSEKERSQRERRLPDNLPVRHREQPITSKQQEMTALAYLLSDVIYQIMFDLCEQMQSGGTDLRHETKYRFNDMFKAAKLFRDKAKRISNDITLLKNCDSVFDDFFEDSEWICDVIKILYNRVQVSDEARVKIRAMLFNMPEK